MFNLWLCACVRAGKKMPLKQPDTYSVFMVLCVNIYTDRIINTFAYSHTHSHAEASSLWQLRGQVCYPVMKSTCAPGDQTSSKLIFFWLNTFILYSIYQSTFFQHALQARASSEWLCTTCGCWCAVARTDCITLVSFHFHFSACCEADENNLCLLKQCPQFEPKKFKDHP